MKSLGRKPEGLRLDRMKASPRWAGEGFRNLHPIPPGLREAGAQRPTLSDFLCGGNRRVPTGPLQSSNPTGTRLVTPRLGEPVEPAHANGVTPWWREVDASERGPLVEDTPALTMPKSMPWPID
jgi:hypothetical protein